MQPIGEQLLIRVTDVQPAGREIGDDVLEEKLGRFDDEGRRVMIVTGSVDRLKRMKNIIYEICTQKTIVYQNEFEETQHEFRPGKVVTYGQLRDELEEHLWSILGDEGSSVFHQILVDLVGKVLEVNINQLIME